MHSFNMFGSDDLSGVNLGKCVLSVFRGKSSIFLNSLSSGRC